MRFKIDENLHDDFHKREPLAGHLWIVSEGGIRIRG